MPHVAGQIRIGFEAPAGDAYLTLTDAEMKSLKNKVTVEVDGQIDLAFRNTWDSVDIDVDAEGHVPESDVRTWLLARLMALTGNAVISLAPPDSFASVRYTLWNGRRKCEHCHRLTLAGADWTVASDEQPAVSVQLLIQIGWSIPV